MKSSIVPQVKEVWKSVELQDISTDPTLQVKLQRRLLDFVHVGKFFYYIFDIKSSNFPYISPDVENVLGVTADELTVERYISMIHPEDQPLFLNFEAAAVDFFQNLPPEKVLKYKFSYDLRIIRPDGQQIRLLQQTTTLSYDSEQESLQTLGVQTDITHIKPSGRSTMSFIGFDGEPSFYDIDVKNRYNKSPEVFTKREKQIVRMIVEGASSEAIASNFNISKHTVESHRKNILKKIGVKTTVELVVKVISDGLI